MDLNTILFHLGEDRERYFNAVAPPIIQSSNFAFKPLEDIRAALSEEMDQYIYTRGNNPTVDILRKKWPRWKTPKMHLFLAMVAPQ